MSSQSSDDRVIAERARELYWGSAQSVNSIASDLGLSKGKFYGLIDPLPAGTACDVCGSELVFENRTARERGTPVCQVCRARAEGRQPPPAPGAPAPPTPNPKEARGRAPATKTRPAKSAAPPKPRPSRPSAPRPVPRETAGAGEGGTRLVAGILLGAFAGLVLFRYLRR